MKGAGIETKLSRYSTPATSAVLRSGVIGTRPVAALSVVGGMAGGGRSVMVMAVSFGGGRAFVAHRVVRSGSSDRDPRRATPVADTGRGGPRELPPRRAHRRPPVAVPGLADVGASPRPGPGVAGT